METNTIMGDLLRTGISLYVLSIMIRIFDQHVARLLKQVSYLSAIAFMVLLINQMLTIGINLTTAIGNLAHWRPW